MKFNPKLSMIIVVFTLLIITAPSAFASYQGGLPDLNLLLEEVNPTPVEPGEDVTVKVRIINEGGDLAEDVSVKLETDHPFYLKNTTDNPKQAQSLCVGCSMDNTYYLNVDGGAKSGNYPLTFKIKHKDVDITPEEKVDIKIVGEPDILLQTEKLEQKVTSGEKFTLNYSIKNVGTGIGRNIKMIPTSDNIFMPGSNVKLVNKLPPEHTKKLSSEFIVKESLQPDTYKFPINLEYTDERGNTHQEKYKIGVNVLNKADLGIQSIKTEPSNPTTSDNVQLEGILENTGQGEAEEVKVELTIGDRSYQTFVGQLEADDDSPFYFEISPEQAGMNTAELKISYEDDFGSHEVKTSVKKEVQKSKSTALTVTAILVIIASLIGGYFLYKRSKTEDE